MIGEIKSVEDFQNVIDNHHLVVVDFYAPWCGPCKKIAPELERISEIFSTTKFVKVDIDDLEDLAAELQIRVVPTFIVMKDSKEVRRFTGGSTKVIEEIQEAITAEMSI